jgi:hypothetical protein
MNKKLARELKTVARQLNTLSKKTASMASAFEKAPAKPKAKPAKGKARAAKKPAPAAAPKSKSLTPTDQVLAIMKRFKKGITVESLRDKSGFNEKQISNIVHRACKKGKMKRIGRGMYSVFGI